MGYLSSVVLGLLKKKKKFKCSNKATTYPFITWNISWYIYKGFWEIPKKAVSIFEGLLSSIFYSHGILPWNVSF
jgi:hypothetical protein